MTNSIRFDGGTAVITGAASGIGSGLARHAAALGKQVRRPSAPVPVEWVQSVRARSHPSAPWRCPEAVLHAAEPELSLGGWERPPLLRRWWLVGVVIGDSRV
jgi:NAD(P)-dependent dehydrogenase (short-subunit alcohol dehydrogenase family)